MSVTRKLQPAQITRAIVQVVGELQGLGQEVRISDVSAFLGCTKATAKKYLDKAIFHKAVVCHPKAYRSTASVFTYELAEYGMKVYGTTHCIDSKNAVMSARGILT